MLGQKVDVKIDRPMGSYHPEHKDMYYPINYGYIDGLLAPDDEEQDVYVLGVQEPLTEFTGNVIAVVRRDDDVEMKWVAAPEGVTFTREEIMEQIMFTEQYYKSHLLMLTDFITPEEYMEMRDVVGWSQFPIEQAKEGLKNSAYICCIREDDKPVALGRVIWDHGYVVYIADIIVRPEYQGKGLGREVMEHVMETIRSWLKPDYKLMVSLMSAKGKEEFYSKFGFETRPNDLVGCGMHQWL